MHLVKIDNINKGLQTTNILKTKNEYRRSWKVKYHVSYTSFIKYKAMTIQITDLSYDQTKTIGERRPLRDISK